jgi:hypothetical protein
VSGSLDPTLRELNDCGCCEGISRETPDARFNRPGLSAVAYRAGDWTRFKETLLARLSSSDLPAFARLKTRSEDDFTIALLDAFSVMADVLTFYQERNANEFLLRTATELTSVRELARLIGYELSPGVAANAYLAFTVEDASGGTQIKAIAAQTDNTALVTPPATSPVIPAGTKVQSLPGPGEQAQTFETTEEISARPEWNQLRPRSSEPRFPKPGETAAWLAGAPVVEPGDRLLFVGQERLDSPTSTLWNFRRVVRTQADSLRNRTRIVWDQPLAAPPAESRIYVFRQRASVFGHNAPDWMSLPKDSKLSYLGLGEDDEIPAQYAAEWPEFEIFSPKYPVESGTTVSGGIIDSVIFAKKAAAQTPHARASVGAIEKNIAKILTGRTLPALTNDTIDLDQSYPKIAEGGWIVLSLPDGPELYSATHVAESSRSSFLLSAKTTRIQLLGNLSTLDSRFKTEVRHTAVFAQSEELLLAETPLLDPIWKDEILLDTAVSAIAEGRTLIVTGRRARRVRVGSTNAPLTLVPDSGAPLLLYTGTELHAATDPEPLPRVFNRLRWRLMTDDGLVGSVDALSGVIEYVNLAADDDLTVSEVAAVNSVSAADETHSLLGLATSLVNVYRRETVAIAANVARATHGESVTELLGSGDASATFPAFPLKQSPLTYVTSSDPAGGSSTLAVRVNDLLWEEVPSLYARAPDERVYTTELGESGTTTVRFGNGKQGARLPTGNNNVRAVYRKGIGLGGMVAAGRLSQLMTRPLGVKEVVNPLAAEGAQDAESIDDARRNAPLKILTLDRVVSLQDYEDFARAFAGIGKAAATWTWSGERNGVFLTVAGAGGSPLTTTGETVTNLAAALHALGDPRVPLTLEPYRPIAFRLTAGLTIAPEYQPDIVLTAAEEELRTAFSFDAREFGQSVALSEIVAVIHRVAGVTAVNVTELYREDEPAGPNALLFAFLPRAGTDTPVPGELLTIQPDAIALEVL